MIPSDKDVEVLNQLHEARSAALESALTIAAEQYAPDDMVNVLARVLARLAIRHINRGDYHMATVTNAIVSDLEGQEERLINETPEIRSYYDV